MMDLPTINSKKSIQEFVRIGNRFGVYYGKTKISQFLIENYLPFRVKVPIQIPANTLNFDITAFNNNINVNPLALIYNTPSTYPVFYIIGVSWNSPFVELLAYDPSGTPYFQVGPNTVTPVYLEGDIYDPAVWFGGQNNRVPKLSFTRRTTDILVPYPLNQPLYFTVTFTGYALRIKNLGNIPLDQVSQLPFVVWLYSQNPEIYTPEVLNQ